MPSDTDFLTQSISQLTALLAKGEVSPVDLVHACLDRIERRNAELNAFISVCADSAREDAQRAEREIASGNTRSPLHGIPISIKDLIDIQGLPTTAASRVRPLVNAERDAPVVTALRQAGAIILGTNNLHEFACGTTSEHSAFGPVRHPLNPGCLAGGSSGGSAAAVADGMAIAAIGTDTGGSIRIPAAVCGIVGFKPAYGEISCDGVIPLSRTLDHVGPLTRSVRDAWILYRVMTHQPASFDPPEPITLASVTFAVPHPYFLERLDAEVRKLFDVAIASLTSAGASVIQALIPHAPETSAIYTHIMLPEAAAFHAATLDRTPDLYTADVRNRLALGRYVLAEDYVRAQAGREVLKREVDTALQHCHALVLPTVPILAPTLGADTVTIDGTSESVRALMLRLTQLFNLTGSAAISIPCGRSSSGLPVGLQLVGRSSSELLSIAAACESRLR